MAELRATPGDGPCRYAAGITAPMCTRDLTPGPGVLHAGGRDGQSVKDT
ncbi:hypothetical protein [Streptomyces sp. HUAS TT20]|nr:hypothetical protein [Streptomyces sp. HUAS 15-9]UXY30261.1 hypothetical protein N8I87_29420 [Streptomyces sp. HUAS 15-9]